MKIETVLSSIIGGTLGALILYGLGLSVGMPTPEAFDRAVGAGLFGTVVGFALNYWREGKS